MDAAARVRRPAGDPSPRARRRGWPGRTTPLRTGSAGFVAGPRVARAEDGGGAAAAKAWSGAPVLVGARRHGGRRVASWPAASTSSTSPRTAGTPRRTRCSPASSSSTAPGSATTSTGSTGARRGAALGLRGRPIVRPLGRGADRDDRRVAARRSALRHRRPRRSTTPAAHDVLVARARGAGRRADPAAALAETVPAVSADTAPAPFVCFG